MFTVYLRMKRRSAWKDNYFYTRCLPTGRWRRGLAHGRGVADGRVAGRPGRGQWVAGRGETMTLSISHVMDRYEPVALSERSLVPSNLYCMGMRLPSRNVTQWYVQHRNKIPILGFYISMLEFVLQTQHEVKPKMGLQTIPWKTYPGFTSCWVCRTNSIIELMYLLLWLCTSPCTCTKLMKFETFKFFKKIKGLGDWRFITRYSQLHLIRHLLIQQSGCEHLRTKRHCM